MTIHDNSNKTSLQLKGDRRGKEVEAISIKIPNLLQEKWNLFLYLSGLSGYATMPGPGFFCEGVLFRGEGCTVRL